MRRTASTLRAAILRQASETVVPSGIVRAFESLSFFTVLSLLFATKELRQSKTKLVKKIKRHWTWFSRGLIGRGGPGDAPISRRRAAATLRGCRLLRRRRSPACGEAALPRLRRDRIGVHGVGLGFFPRLPPRYDSKSLVRRHSSAENDERKRG